VGIEAHQPHGVPVRQRELVSSLTRSLFTGTCVVFRNGELPLFRVERKGVEEVHVPSALADKTEASRREAEREFLFAVAERAWSRPSRHTEMQTWFGVGTSAPPQRQLSCGPLSMRCRSRRSTTGAPRSHCQSSGGAFSGPGNILSKQR
jgi:hypothetical protein